MNSLETRLLALGVWLLIVSIGSFATFALLRSLFRGIGTSLGATPRTRLFSAGIACLLFASTVERLVRTVVRLGLELYVNVPLTILQAQPKDDSEPDVADVLSEYAARVFSELRLDSLGYVEILLFLAMWAAIAKMIDGTNGDSQQEPRAVGRGALTALIGIGTFLSVASLIATPVLRDTSDLPDKISPDELRKKIEANTPSEATLKAQYPEDVTGDPFEALKTALSDQRAKLVAAQTAPAVAKTPTPPVADPGAVPDPAPPAASTTPPAASAAPDDSPPPVDDRSPDVNIKVILARVAEFVEDQSRQRQKLLKLWKETRTAAIEDQHRASNRALTEFDVGGVGRKGSREAVDHFRNVLDWYQSGLDESLRGLGRCQSALAIADDYWREASSSLARQLSDADWQAVQSRLEFEPGPRVFDTQLGCRSFGAVGEPPSRVSPGYNLGPFSFLATWLLKTESLALTALIGMFGFGLIGAAMRATAASPAQRQATAQHDVLPHSPVAAIVLRSITAAIIVFLAIQGGLAVVSDQAAAANPYLLYFLCFVASVFSEEVWLWARRKLLGGLNGDDGEPSGGEPEN